jgi:hypothetical protein
MIPGFCSMNQVYSGKAAIFLEKSAGELLWKDFLQFAEKTSK